MNGDHIHMKCDHHSFSSICSIMHDYNIIKIDHSCDYIDFVACAEEYILEIYIALLSFVVPNKHSSHFLSVNQ